MKAIAAYAVIDLVRGKKANKETAIEFIAENKLWISWAMGRGVEKINWLLAEYQ